MTARAITLTLALVLASATACGGGGSGGGDVTTSLDATDTSTGGDGTVVTPGPRVEAAWQILYGADPTGSYDQEGLLGLGVAEDGTIVALADRRFSDDPYGPRLLLARVDPDGTSLGVETLAFARNVEVDGFAVRPNGNVVLAIESGSALELDVDGAVLWAVELSREPYAFGGLKVATVALDDDGNVYLAGAFNPSEASAERGFVIKLGPTGEAQWMRSWPHENFVENQQLAVGPSGVYVGDRLPGEQEVSSQFGVFAFDADGATLGRRGFALPGSDLFSAISRGTLIADSAGVTVIGARSTAVDEDFAMLVYRLALDATLTVTAQGGTRVPADRNIFARTVVAVRAPDGAVHAALRLEDGYALLRYPAGALAAEAYDLVRDDGESPVTVDDEDLPLLLAAGDGATYFGGTARSTGTIAIAPRASVALGLPFAPEELPQEIFEDALTAEAVTIEVTVADDTAGATGQADDEDEDLLLFRAPF